MIINFTRNTILVSFVAFFSGLQAQITITKNDMPKSGDTIRYSIVLSATGTDFSVTGANHTWDFTGLKSTAQDIYSYKAFTATPYLFYSQFLGAIGLKTADSVPLGITTLKQLYTFYKVSSTKWTAEGSGFTVQGIPLASDYSDADIIYNFPLTYNQNDSDTYKVTTTIPTLGSYQQSGKRHNTVDGWGKISTPYASNINCIRIKSVTNEIDSLKTTFVKFGFPLTTVTYKWLSNTEKIPVLEVSGTEVGGNFIPASIRYRDTYHGSSSSSSGPRVRFITDHYAGVSGKDTFVFTNQTTPSSGNVYQWTFTPSTGITYANGTSSNSANPKVIFGQAGVYTVKLSATSLNGTSDSTAVNMITITDPHVGITSAAITSDIILYPNPVAHTLFIQAPVMEGAAYIITDASGKTISSGVVSEQRVPVNALAPGNYYLLLKSPNAVPCLKTFIKQ